MEKQRGGSGVGFAMDGEEPQLRSIITRSSSSQPLLGWAPYSHRAVVAAAVGEEAATAVSSATPERVGTVAYQHDEEVMMAGREGVVTVAGQETPPFLPAGVHDGCGERVKSSVWGYVGRLFQHGDGGSSEGEAASSKEGDRSSQEDGGEEHNKEKKKKKRWSWMPDPDKRWPIQGFY